MENKNQGTIRLRLHEILEMRGMKQKHLAKLTGISENSISLLNNNDITQIRLSTLASVCDALSIQPSDLLEYTPGDKSIN